MEVVGRRNRPGFQAASFLLDGVETRAVLS
jgi:hypothetical protein